MRRTIVISAISSLILSSGFFFSVPAHAYYQDKFNPKSKNYNPSNAGYQNGPGNRYMGGPYQRRSFNFPSEIESTGKRVFIYDPKQLSWAVYDQDGQRIRTGPGSGGNHYCSDVGRGCRTPTGVYNVYSKAGPYYRSKIYPLPRGGAPMPYAMFFRGGYAIHGSYDVPNFNASHGCIRVLPTDAAWLSANFLNHGSTVIVKPYN